MREEESPTKMAHQLSSYHIPSTNEEVRVSPPSSEEVVQALETEVVVIDKQNNIVNDHLARPKTRKGSTKEDNIVEQSSALQTVVSSSTCSACKEVSSGTTTSCEASTGEDSGRERLKRHRIEVVGRVWIPDIWGQEDLLKDWIDCSAFDACLVPKGIMSAREALVEEGRTTTSGRRRIENRC